MNSKEKAMEAWKTFVATGEVPEGYVRPEIEASWRRCRNAGLSPWSSDFDDCNIPLLREKQKRFRSSIEAVEPVAQMLVALLDCNVSLMDGENFVFYLVTPYTNYPRTVGTFMDERKLGTGNATLVQYEKRPVRVDGFEHYRVVSQRYSGVAVPYLDRKGRYIGAMNLNSLFSSLAECALDLGQVGVEMSQRIFLAGDRASAMLASADFFKPLLLLCDFPVAVLDEDGNLLTVNGAMDSYLPGWEEAPYGTVNIKEYLSKDVNLDDILDVTTPLSKPMDLAFKKRRSKAVKKAKLLRRCAVNYNGNAPFIVCVFSDEAGEAKARASQVRTIRRSDGPVSTEGEVDYIGESVEWRAVDEMVNRVAPIKANVLVLGETGTGKEMVAHAIHRRSGRKGEFVSINCGALPRDLLATELFGYERGAFTGANEDGALGKFEYANGGTLFLDEIGEMPLDMQVSLLRFLQDRTITRLGSNEQKELDVRVVAATNRDLTQLVSERRFRADLYYRLSLMEIHLPPLRVRKGDVALLTEYFNDQVSTMLECGHSPFPPEIVAALERYSWPGNVRELRNVVERCLIMAGEGAKVTSDMLSPHFQHGSYSASADSRGFLTFSVPHAYRTEADDGSTDRTLMAANHADGLSKWELADLLRRNDGDVVRVSHALGVTTDELLTRMDEAGLRIHVMVE